MPTVDEDLVLRANARLGTVLNGKYKLDRVLGIGGMATVYAATHRNGKEFAVKVLHADLSLRSDTRTRFLREGYLANRVDHPGALAVLDDDTAEDGGAFLVMELLRGQTVDAIWEREARRLPLEVVVGIGIELLDVLAAAHSSGLTHRDIKPGNVMLTHEGHVKVLDFGIARLRDVANVHTTQTGMVMGTPAFMAPEHALAKTDEIDAQTDLWSVGATLFTLASGSLVHEADNAQQTLVKAARDQARRFSEVMPTAPPAVSAVIDKALAYDKADRWTNATAMQAALRQAALQAFGAIPSPATDGLVGDFLAPEKTTVLGPTGAPHEEPRDLVPAEREADVSDGSLDAERIAAGTLVGMPPAEVEPPTNGPPVGLVTAAALATDSHARRSVPKGRGVVTAALVVGALGVGALLAFALRPRASKGVGPAGSVVQAPSSATTESVSATPPSESSISDAPAWTAVAPSAPPDSPVRAAHAEQADQGPLPAVAPAGSRAPRPSRPPASAPPSLPPTATATMPDSPAQRVMKSCSPPYEFDASGTKRWKRECL